MLPYQWYVMVTSITSGTCSSSLMYFLLYLTEVIYSYIFDMLILSVQVFVSQFVVHIFTGGERLWLKENV